MPTERRFRFGLAGDRGRGSGTVTRDMRRTKWRGPLLAFAAMLLPASPVRAGGHLWIGSAWVTPSVLFQYDIATATITHHFIVGLGLPAGNLAIDGEYLYLGSTYGQQLWKSEIDRLEVLDRLDYMLPVVPDALVDGAWRASNDHLYRANCAGSPNLYETDTDGNVLGATRSRAWSVLPVSRSWTIGCSGRASSIRSSVG